MRREERNDLSPDRLSGNIRGYQIIGISVGNDENRKTVTAKRNSGNNRIREIGGARRIAGDQKEKTLVSWWRVNVNIYESR